MTVSLHLHGEFTGNFHLPTRHFTFCLKNKLGDFVIQDKHRMKVCFKIQATILHHVLLFCKEHISWQKTYLRSRYLGWIPVPWQVVHVKEPAPSQLMHLEISFSSPPRSTVTLPVPMQNLHCSREMEKKCLARLKCKETWHRKETNRMIYGTLFWSRSPVRLH